MRDYVITCCSTVDMTSDTLNQNGVRCLSFPYTIDGVEYKDDFGSSLPLPEFYQKMMDGAITRTSQINITEYVDFFDGILAGGQDILHISMSSGLSGTVNSARNAAAIVSERYPEGRILVVDSLCGCGGYGMLVLEAARRKEQGDTLVENARFVEENKMRMNHWFFTTDLKYLIRGGRVSKVSGVIGGLLNICPIMAVDSEGRIVLRAKVRTKKRAISEMVDRMERCAADSLSYRGKCFICHSMDPEDAAELASQIEQRFTDLDGRVEIFDIGTVIGSHCGPGTVSLYFWGTGRD